MMIGDFVTAAVLLMFSTISDGTIIWCVQVSQHPNTVSFGSNCRDDGIKMVP